jgi:hypothetical protein
MSKKPSRPSISVVTQPKFVSLQPPLTLTRESLFYSGIDEHGEGNWQRALDDLNGPDDLPRVNSKEPSPALHHNFIERFPVIPPDQITYSDFDDIIDQPRKCKAIIKSFPTFSPLPKLINLHRQIPYNDRQRRADSFDRLLDQGLFWHAGGLITDYVNNNRVW